MTSDTTSHSMDDILTQYHQAEKWLFTLITDPTGARYFQDKSMETRLQEFTQQMQRMRKFQAFVGNPESQFSSVHVAGTSGKGSVVNMLAAILRQTGLRVGYHVSPYLQVCNEKLVVDGRMIAPSEFTRLVNDFRDQYELWQAADPFEGDLKYGEGWVALTFLWMARQKVDWAVIETGLGGRYDPTNVVPSKLAVITNVDYDHMEVLGERLEEIASHKAGIIKPNGLAITSETKPEVLAVMEAEAIEKQARLLRLGVDFDYEYTSGDAGCILVVHTPWRTFRDIRIAMRGGFQHVNAALAATSVDVLTHEYGVPVTEEHVQAGLASVVYPGRFEVVQEQPTVILDGAHNRHKAGAFAESLADMYPGKKMIMVLGTLSIKDFSGIIAALAPLTRLWVATQPRVFGKPGASPERLAEVIARVTPEVPVIQSDNVGVALDEALSRAAKEDIVVVTGSLYMLGEARERWYPAEDILVRLEQAIQSS